jgi:hypothetical protein
MIVDVLCQAKRQWNQKWTNWWSNINVNYGQAVKTRTIKNTTDEWRVTSFGSREMEYKITRLRLGHTKFSHDHVFTRTDRRRCRCGEVLTVDHILRLCTLVDDARDRHEVSLMSLNGDQFDIDRVVAFFKEIDLWNEI